MVETVFFLPVTYVQQIAVLLEITRKLAAMLFTWRKQLHYKR